MPYLIIKRGGKWKLYKKGKDGHPVGKALGTHDSKTSAERQRRAIYANEKKQTVAAAGGISASEYSALNPAQSSTRSVAPARTQVQVNYITQTRDPMRHCSICSHYLSAGTCALVENMPDSIEEQGFCDEYADIPESRREVGEMELTSYLRSVQEQEGTGKGFVYLSLKYEWEIERIQDALYKIFGYTEGWTWVDAWLLHITLAFAPEIDDATLLEATKAIVGKTAPNLKFTGFGVFPSEDGTYQTLYLKVEQNDALLALQKAVYDTLVAAGATLSELSSPDMWVPHVSLARIPAGATVPLEAELDIEAWYVNKVCIARSDYNVIAELPLSYPREGDLEDGSAPVAVVAVAVAQMSDWRVSASNDYTNSVADWDQRASALQALESAGFGSDFQPDVAKRAFLLQNASLPNSPYSYRIPLAQMIDGKWVITEKALRSAERELATMNIPEVECAKAQEILASYRKKMGISEMHQESVKMTMVSEMAGNYPNIPLPEDIDVKALGENAFFVTLPIGQIGAKSRNNRTYSQTAVEELVAQINQMRPEGIWGHMNDEDMAFRYDPPSIRWIAAMIDSEGVAWGKGLPLNEQTREYYRLAKATNAQVGTSLVAWAQMEKDEVLHMELRWVDIADPRRVGVPMTAAKAMITTEMEKRLGDVIFRTSNGTDYSSAVEDTSKPKTVLEKGTDVPETGGKNNDSEAKVSEKEMAELAEIQAENERLKAQLAEMASKGNPDAAALAQLQEQHKTLATEASFLLAEFIKSEVEREVKVESFWGQARKWVQMSNPQTREQVKAAVKAYMDDEDNQTAMKGAVQEQMGESQDVPNGGKRSEKPASTPARRDETNPIGNPAGYAKELAGSQYFVVPNLTEIERREVKQ